MDRAHLGTVCILHQRAKQHRILVPIGIDQCRVEVAQHAYSGYRAKCPAGSADVLVGLVLGPGGIGRPEHLRGHAKIVGLVLVLLLVLGLGLGLGRLGQSPAGVSIDVEKLDGQLGDANLRRLFVPPSGVHAQLDPAGGRSGRRGQVQVACLMVGLRLWLLGCVVFGGLTRGICSH